MVAEPFTPESGLIPPWEFFLRTQNNSRGDLWNSDIYTEGLTCLDSRCPVALTFCFSVSVFPASLFLAAIQLSYLRSDCHSALHNTIPRLSFSASVAMQSSLFLVALLGLVLSAPLMPHTIEDRALINISPDLDISITHKDNNECIGIGISVCDPINVNGTQNAADTSDDSSSTSSSDDESSSSTSSGGDALINISPDLDIDIDDSGNNECFGIGISACDPINVNGNQNTT